MPISDTSTGLSTGFGLRISDLSHQLAHLNWDQTADEDQIRNAALSPRRDVLSLSKGPELVEGSKGGEPATW